MRRACAAVFIFALLNLGDAKAGDILSCKGNQYETPSDCDNVVKVSLSCPVKKRCRLIPTCAALKNENYQILYNQALFFGYGVLPPQAARITLISEVLTHFYKINPTKFDISLVDDRTKEWEETHGPNAKADWAHYEQVHGAGQKPPLVVSEDTFWRSPAFLISVLGHEMVHYEQDQRKFEGINLTGLDYAITSFYELEASSWEVGANNGFNWKIGPNKVIPCLKGTEPNEPKLTLRCREWQTKNAIDKLRSLPIRSETRMAQLKLWLEKNPWTSQVWLPKNPQWQGYTPGTKPAECADFN